MDQKELQGTALQIHYAPGTALKAERVVAQFRKMHKVVLEHGSSTHKIQRTKLEGTVFCVIDRALSPIRSIVEGNAADSKNTQEP